MGENELRGEILVRGICRLPSVSTFSLSHFYWKWHMHIAQLINHDLIVVDLLDILRYDRHLQDCRWASLLHTFHLQKRSR